jgi:hypothetical protein
MKLSTVKANYLGRRQRLRIVGDLHNLLRWLSVVLAAALVESVANTTKWRALLFVVFVALALYIAVFLDRKGLHGTGIVVQLRRPSWNDIKFANMSVAASHEFKHHYPLSVAVPELPDDSWATQLSFLLDRVRIHMDPNQGSTVDLRRFGFFINMPTGAAWWLGGKIGDSNRQRVAVWAQQDNGYEEAIPAHVRPTLLNYALLRSSDETFQDTGTFDAIVLLAEGRTHPARAWLQTQPVRNALFALHDDVIPPGEFERFVNTAVLKIGDFIRTSPPAPQIFVLTDVPDCLAFAIGQRLHLDNHRFQHTTFEKGEYHLFPVLKS